MGKKGQIELSFGMIFSIIIIIAVIATAFYVISYFLRLGSCTDISLFYQDLQKETDSAWASTISQKVFEGKVPGSVESVCFGDINSNTNQIYNKESEFLKRYRNQEVNVFLYPGTKACDAKLSVYKLNHAEIKEFFCVKTASGKVSVKISKESNSSLAEIKK